MSLKFSVVTPSYCQGRFIERTIESVFAQKMPEMEYVICDGGSNDETLKILKSYGDKICWVSEPDKGQSDAVNKGIAMTTGDIIAWINSDDVYYPGTFETVKAIFEANPDVEIIYGDADHIDEYDNIIEPYPTQPWDYKKLFNTCYLCQPAVFFRRSLVEKYGNLDISLNYCMDYELWLRYGKHINFYYLPKKLAGSRMYKGNKTLGQRIAVCTEINDMLRRELGFVPSQWIFGYAHVKLEETMGLDRTDPCQNRQFVNRLVSTSIWSFWHWKTWIPPKDFVKICMWWISVNRFSLKSRLIKMLKVFKPIYNFLTAPLYRRLHAEMTQELQRINQSLTHHVALEKNSLIQELQRINQNHLELQSQLSQQVADEFVKMYKLILEGKVKDTDEQINAVIIDELRQINKSIKAMKVEENAHK